MSRQQVERRVDVAETFAVDQPILPFSGGALALVKKLSKILARCLAISWLMSAADDDVQASPRLSPTSLRHRPRSACSCSSSMHTASLERVSGEGADVFLQSIELHDAFRENSVHERTCTAQQLGGRLHHL